MTCFVHIEQTLIRSLIETIPQSNTFSLSLTSSLLVIMLQLADNVVLRDLFTIELTDFIEFGNLDHTWRVACQDGLLEHLARSVKI